jgi:exopolysaccharide production protein ExoQ
MYRWYHWLSALFLLSAIDAFGFIDRVMYGFAWANKTGDTITTTVRLFLILEALTLFNYSYLTNRNGPRGLSVGCNLALFTVGFLFVTSFWSMDAAATYTAATVYLFIVLGAIGIARILDPERFMHLLSCACFLTAIGSLLLAIVSPGNAFVFGYDALVPDFIGIFPHKNVLGQTMAVGALACLHGIRVARRPPLYKIVMLLVFTGMTVAAKSTSALLVILSFCGISAFFMLWQKGGAARGVAILLAIGIAPVLIAIIVAPDPILELIGKDPTLTGRTEIWAFVTNDIWMKPLFGWGYFGFWHFNNPAAREISDAVHWTVPEAHNGLLELLLDLGFVGTALFFWLFIRNLSLAFRCLGTPAKALAVSAIICCVGLLMHGVSETVLLAATEPLTPIFFVTGLMCERAVWITKRRRFQAQRPQYAGGHSRTTGLLATRSAGNFAGRV